VAALLCSFGLVDARQASSGSASSPSSAAALDSATAPVPALLVVDAINTLRSYDADGRLLQEMPVDQQRAVLNGGALLAMGTVYLTYERPAVGAPGSAIAAFDAKTLQPLMVRKGAFKATDVGDPGHYTGLAFDPAASEFYIATERLGILVFDRTAKYLRRTPAAAGQIAGIAFDSGETGVWGVMGRHDVVLLARADSAPTLLELKSRLKKARQEPLAVAVCRADKEGAPAAALVVLFRAASRGVAAGGARAFDLTGMPIGNVFDGVILNPHGVACTARDDIFIAADNGLLGYGLDGRRRALPGALANLDKPILGVAAAP